jgi:pimeloyl-ACP methyl ester carboxylesterase
VITSATDNMMIRRIFRALSSDLISSTIIISVRSFLIGILLLNAISARVTLGEKLSRAETTKPTKLAHPPITLPLTSFYDAPHPLPMGKPGELIRSETSNHYSLPYELSVLRLLYHSRTSRGEDVAVSGLVLIPDGKPPASGWPIIAWAHEFRGAARQCAPSLMRNLGVGPLLAMYANLGYAVVATDYAGLGADSGKAVVDMQSNALDIIYAVTAARSAAKEIGAKWIAVGAFQGALASIGIAENEMRDPNYLGSIATSGLAESHLVYERSATDPSARPLLSLVSTMENLYPEFKATEILTDKAISAYKHASESCVADAHLEFPQEIMKPGWNNNRFVKELFARNSPGLKAAHGPLLVISGEIDPIVPVETTAITVARLCKQGDKVLFLKYPNLDSSGVMGASAGDQISWIKARFAGYPAPNNCRQK